MGPSEGSVALSGYKHPQYADSLSEFGTPYRLQRCGGFALGREIPGSSYHDAMGCYPLFACQDWSKLHLDLDDVGDRWISLSVVTDPFGEYDQGYLRKCFGDLVLPFKEHHVADLGLPVNARVSKHHRYYARKALEKVTVEQCDDPVSLLDEWVDLYSILVERHEIKGLRAFSKTSFAGQLDTPGMVMFRAESQGITVGAHLWCLQDTVAYSHLAASHDLGYELMAAYALHWYAAEYFTGRVSWLNFGAGAGLAGEGTDGLSRFKQGWASETRTAYFCGRIFDQELYSRLVQAKGVPSTDYFPAYRKDEFA